MLPNSFWPIVGVTVYEARGHEWFDRGTGVCISRLSKYDRRVMVMDPEQEGRSILDKSLRSIVNLHRPADKSLTWSEAGQPNVALSFETAEDRKTVQFYMLQAINLTQINFLKLGPSENNMVPNQALERQIEEGFVLSTDTVDTLAKYHREVFLVDRATNLWSWPDKEDQLQKLHEEFLEAAGAYFYQPNPFEFADAFRIADIEGGWARVLPPKQSDKIREDIRGFFKPLLPISPQGY